MSFVLLISPFYLFEIKADVQAKTGISFDERSFVVSISYRDGALNQHLGRVTDPLTQCQVYKAISARGHREAIEKARRLFEDSDLSLQFSSGRRDPADRRHVEIIDTWIVAQASN